ncbi:hypothetical protein Tco_0020335 [Tanacetum coccineum]
MVAFLSKPQGSEGFHQILDFLNASHIMYALTETSTIYVSLINWFWCTASVRTLDSGEIELIATVDGQEKSITEAFVRRHLKLADSDKLTFQKGFSAVETALFATMLVHEQLSQDEAITKEMHDGLGRATTTTSSL